MSAAAIRTKTTTFFRRTVLPAFRNAVSVDKNRVSPTPMFFTSSFSGSRSMSSGGGRGAAAAAAKGGIGGKKTSVHFVQFLLLDSKERDESPPPKIRLQHVSVILAKSGGTGGHRDNKVDPKVGMRFNVKNATWLSERIRDKILLLEKNKINKDGEIIVSSSKTRTQQGNIQACLAKLQAIIDAAAYVPPPPSELQMKKIAELAALSEQKRQQNKKVLSQKKGLL